MKKIVSLIIVMTILMTFGLNIFAEVVEDQDHLKTNSQRTDLTILVDTPTELIYTYKYQGSFYKNIESIQRDIIETEVYELNENTQEYEITDSFITVIDDLDIDIINIPENTVIPHTYEDPTTYMYRYSWTEEGSTHIANMSLADIRAAILLLVPGGWAHNAISSKNKGCYYDRYKKSPSFFIEV